MTNVTINVVILASGNGTNMENLVLSLHNKTITQALRQNGLNLTKNITSSVSEPLQTKSDSFVINSANIQDSMLAKDPKINVINIISDNANAHALLRAKRLGLPVHVIESSGDKVEFDRALLLYLKDLENSQGLSCILLAGFMRILGKEFLHSMSHIRILNIHPSFLPLHKGLHGIEKSYADGNDFGGVSVHFVTQELDSGMIILQEKVPKILGESLEDFTQRVHDVEYRLYPQAFLKAFAQGIHNVS